jgi:hypothetical protein
MEVSQGNSLCSYLKQTKMSFFFFYKIRELEGSTGSAGGEGVPVKGREDVGKGCGRVNISANTVFTVLGKMIPIETVPGMGEGGDKGECWRE